MAGKFEKFTDSELEILGDALEVYGAPNLLKQVNAETRYRESKKKQDSPFKNTSLWAIANGYD